MKKNTDIENKILIIGAGPAGMAAGMKLSNASKKFTIIEKDKQVGGLSKTYEIQEGPLTFRTDNGPHRFFSKNQYLYDFVEDLLDEKWILVPRHTQQFINGTYFDYPINIKQVAKNIPLLSIIKIIFDYFVAFIQYRVLRKPINNFHDYAIASFGKKLAQFNIIGYTEKIWGISTKELHADWAKQRITGLNIFSLLGNTLKKTFSPNKQIKTLVDAFYYPENGTGLIYETILKEIKKNKNKVLLETYPVEIKHTKNKITEVTISSGGELITLRPEHIIESIHIVDFLKLLNPAPPSDILQAVSKLKYRSQVYLFITLNKERITPNQWIYFPDKNTPFARVSEMKNFSEKMSPPDKTSLFIEFFCDKEDPIYKMSKEELLEEALPHFEKYGFFKKEDIRNVYLMHGGKDYPIYDLHYKENLKIVKDYLDLFENLHYIGRPGRFIYTNQDHSLEMGILAAQSILDGKEYDLDDVGGEQEYFEKGYVR